MPLCTYQSEMKETKKETYFVICDAETLPCIICIESSSECMNHVTRMLEKRSTEGKELDRDSHPWL